MMRFVTSGEGQVWLGCQPQRRMAYIPHRCRWLAASPECEFGAIIGSLVAIADGMTRLVCLVACEATIR